MPPELYFAQTCEFVCMRVKCVFERERERERERETVLYILTSVWVVHKLNAGQNMLFQVFCTKMIAKKKKQENCGKIKWKPLTSVWVLAPKTGFFPHIFALFSFFPFFMWKTWKKYFTTSVWSIAPKRLAKFTTRERERERERERCSECPTIWQIKKLKSKSEGYFVCVAILLVVKFSHRWLVLASTLQVVNTKKNIFFFIFRYEYFFSANVILKYPHVQHTCPNSLMKTFSNYCTKQNENCAKNWV